MKSRRPSRALIAVAAVATVVLTACGASAPPARELAHEIVDTVEVNGQPVSDAVKDCMHEAIDAFQLTDEELQGFDSLDEVSDKADDGQDQAIAIMARFQSEIADCNGAG